jgi:hypothetical protein
LLLVGGLSLSRLSLGTDVALAEAAPDRSPVSTSLAAPALVRAGQPSAGQPSAGPKTEQIGRSRGGQPLTIFQIGTGRQHVLLLGGQHGAPEANTVVLTNAILDTFTAHPGAVPKSMTLDVLTLANPDGLLAGSRQYLSGVDPNRNWDEADWQPDAYDSLGRFWSGLGGPAPMSEPETRVLAAWIVKRRPALVVNYHSAGGLVSTRQPGRADALAAIYADYSGYPYYSPDEEPFGYPITGAMDGWLARLNIPDIFVELTTPHDAESEENLSGLTAVFAALASG